MICRERKRAVPRTNRGGGLESHAHSHTHTCQSSTSVSKYSSSPLSSSTAHIIPFGTIPTLTPQPPSSPPSPTPSHPPTISPPNAAHSTSSSSNGPGPGPPPP